MDKILQVPVSLSKFDNQSGQYTPFQKFTVTQEMLLRILNLFKSGARLHVTGFYRYQYEFEGKTHELFSASPALFDHPEKISL